MIASDFDRLAQRAAITAPDRFTVDDTPVAAQVASDATVHALTSQLQHHLYERCYLDRPADHAMATGALTDLTPALAAANVHVDRWDPGWTISRVNADGSVHVTREGKSRLAWGGEYHSLKPGAPPAVGTEVRLFVAHEAAQLQPGFYYAFGDTLADALEDIGMVRLYWHATPDGAADLLHDLVGTLRRYALPFRLKVLSAREFFPRPDAMVVYVAQRHVPLTLRLTRQVHARHAATLGEQVPLFSRPLARGLGLAEDPANGESFGMSRCRVAAEGLWNAFVTGANDLASRQRIVREHATRAGLDPDRPWLNPGSTDAYSWED